MSYVLNDSPNQSIPEGTRERVVMAAAALGYVPSAAAVALRRGHSNIVLVLKDAALSGYVTEPFLAAISRRLHEGGYTALTTDYTTLRALTGLVLEIRPWGVIGLAPVDGSEIDALRELGVRRIYHSFATSDEGGAERPWEEEIGRQQAAHLLDRGARRLFFGLPAEGSPRDGIAHSRARGAAREVAARSGGELGLLRLPADRGVARGTLLEVFDREPVVGICCFDDTVAASALAGARDAGIDVPGRLMLIGVDDSPIAALSSPSISSIRVDAQAGGRAVAERLLGIDADSPGRENALQIIARQTSGSDQ